MRCCVSACPNSGPNRKIDRFFMIPKKNNNLWLEVLKINPNLVSEKTKVCSLHFTEEDFFHFSTKVKLKPGVVPSINLNMIPVETSIHSDIGDIAIRPDIVDAEPPVDIEVEETVSQTRKRKRKTIFISKREAIIPTFCIERFWGNDKKISYYTGLPSWKRFITIYNSVFKSEKGPADALQQKRTVTGYFRKHHKLTPINEFFLTLIKLRRAFDYEMLADMFQISKSAVGRIFLAWINLLHEKLSSNIFPHRDVLLDKVSDEFKKKYPNVIGSIDWTELLLQTQSSLKTLKALIMVSGSGEVLFVSALFAGSISDKKIVEESGFMNLLKKKVDIGELNRGDVILADKGFEIETILEDVNVGISLNIPTFRISGFQFEAKATEYIRHLARERAIRRLRAFKILSDKIPVCLLGSINQIFTVCSLLTNYFV